MTDKTESKPKLEVVETPGEDDETCKTFVFHNEDHTLGNSLRYIVMKNPEVQFCGYSIPHPSENKINFRIQTHGTSATDVLMKGLQDLNKASETVLQKFQKSVLDYKQGNYSSDVKMDDS